MVGIGEPNTEPNAEPNAEPNGDIVQDVVCIGWIWVVVQPQFLCIAIEGSSTDNWCGNVGGEGFSVGRASKSAVQA